MYKEEKNSFRPESDSGSDFKHHLSEFQKHLIGKIAFKMGRCKSKSKIYITLDKGIGKSIANDQRRRKDS